MENNQAVGDNDRAFEQEITYGQHALQLAVAESAELDEHYFLGYVQGLERARFLLGGAQ